MRSFPQLKVYQRVSSVPFLCFNMEMPARKKMNSKMVIAQELIFTKSFPKIPNTPNISHRVASEKPSRSWPIRRLGHSSYPNVNSTLKPSSYMAVRRPPS